VKADPANEPAALRKRPQPGRTRAIVLAIAVHVAFFALIIFGVRWQSKPTAPVAADLWDKLPATKKAATPPPVPKPPPAPKPAPPPQATPQPKPDFGPEQLPPAKTEQAKPAPPPPDAAEIAEKAEREKRQRLEREQQAAAQKKLEQEQAAKKKRAQEEAAKKKREQEEAAKKQREDQQRRLAEERAKEEAERERQAAATARQMEIQQWVDKIKAKILSRANVPDTVPTGTEVTVRIRILPGGDVLDIAVTSGANSTYSAAIERAIRSAQPLPVPDPNSDLFPQFRDLNLNFRHER